MNIQDRIEELNKFQTHLLDFIDDDDEQSEENYQELSKLLSSYDFNNNLKDIKPFLNMIINISLNHHRSPTFHDKITRVLTIFLDYLKQKDIFSNYSIFNMFKKDKRLLLFLIQKEVLTIDDKIANIMKNGKYNKYNYSQYFNLDKNEKYSIEKCKIGENDNIICELIRKDLIEEFIIYINQNNILINDFTIEPSIYETNRYLLKNENPNLIEYAAFYGSIQIFKYLQLNGAKLTSSLLNYSIHSNNPELIHILTDNEANKFCVENLKEAIKCHHNEIANYIISNYIKDKKDDYSLAIKYYNYEFCPPEFDINDKNFIYACKYGHFYIVEHFLSLKKIDINASITVPYKNIEILENEESKTKDDHKSSNYKKISDDWTSWNRITEETRERSYKRTRNYWKNRYYEQKISALHFAVENEDIDIVKLLLDYSNINVNNLLIRFYDTKGRHRESLDTKREEKTALHLAVEKGNLEIVKLLCCNPNVRINDKTMDCYPSTDDAREMKTPIHIAIENNDVKIVDFLSHQPHIKINLKSVYEKWWSGGKEEYEEKAPLNLAAEIGNINIFQILLSHPNINVNIELIEFYTTANLSYLYKRKETSFIIAIKKSHYNIVELLLSNSSNDDKAISIKEYRFYKYERKKQFKTPLFLAIENNDIRMVDLILSSKRIDIKNGLIDIGGGYNLNGKPYIGRYNPKSRNDKNKPRRIFNKRRLEYLNKRKDNYTTNGEFSSFKKYQNDVRYLDVTEEEDTNDDYHFRYKIYKRMSPIEASKIIANIEISQMLEKVSSDTNYITQENEGNDEEEYGNNDDYDDDDDYNDEFDY